MLARAHGTQRARFYAGDTADGGSKIFSQMHQADWLFFRQETGAHARGKIRSLRAPGMLWDDDGRAARTKEISCRFYARKQATDVMCERGIFLFLFRSYNMRHVYMCKVAWAPFAGSRCDVSRQGLSDRVIDFVLNPSFIYEVTVSSMARLFIPCLSGGVLMALIRLLPMRFGVGPGNKIYLDLVWSKD